MTLINGLVGLRPADSEKMERITAPPYDVIKKGSRLESLLEQNSESLYHITLGDDPVGALNRLVNRGYLLPDEEPCFFVYEQQYGAQEIRTGVLAAVQVTDYREAEIIRHEKTFDEKVKGRLELRRKTGYTLEPVFLLTKSGIGDVLAKIKNTNQPIYDFVSNFEGESELHGIRNRIFRVKEDSAEVQLLKELIKQGPLYIADGHHRYHASLLNGQTHCPAYICEVEAARIQAYNRVVNGRIPFRKVLSRLPLIKTERFMTPPKHHFAIYSKEGSFLLKAGHIPENDLIGRLDCSVLERELYPLLGLSHDLIKDTRYFDYYPEQDMAKMCRLVDEGIYELAIALNPVSARELLAVAEAGIKDPEIVMPEKSTYFAPKILSGIIIYRHSMLK